ncbi:MAG: hypothetical protein ACKVZJ_06460 [Phycisphaerales bacterium]
MKTPTLGRCLGAITLFTLLAGTADAQSIVGGGVFVDRDPNNDTTAGAAYYLNATQSTAIMGMGTIGGLDMTDFFGYKLPPSTYITAMTIPLGTPQGPFTSPNAGLGLENGDGSVQHVQSFSDGVDQAGTTENSGGAVARARPAAGGNQKIKVIDGIGIGPYAILASVYTGDNGQFVEQEPNNGPAFPVMLGLALGGPKIGTGTLTAGDFDHYGVDMKRGDILAAVTTPCEGFPNDLSTPDTVIDLVGTNGATVILTSDDAGNDQFGEDRGSAIRYRATADGRYFIRVRGFSAATTGKYALTAALIPAPPANLCLGDFNGDGVVNTVDLVAFLGKFSTSCP